MPTEGQDLFYIRRDDRGPRANRSWGANGQRTDCSRERGPQPLLLSPEWEAAGVQVSEYTGVQHRVHPPSDLLPLAPYR